MYMRMSGVRTLLIETHCRPGYAVSVMKVGASEAR